jgi:hypothetical protein
MAGTTAADVKRLVEHLGPELIEVGFRAANVRRLVPRHVGVTDDPNKFLIETSEGRPEAVLIQAPRAAPGIVLRGVERAQQAARLLGPGLGSAVLLPALSGEFEGLSYAVIPWNRPLTDSRWLWRAQRVWIAPRVVRWLTRALEVTARPIPERQLRERVQLPLEQLAASKVFSESTRRGAKNALARLFDGRWKPRSVLVHGDLWKGNILLPSGPDPRQAACGFYLIDWATAEASGFAFWDFARVSMSLALPRPWSRRIALRHCEILRCDAVDAVSYLLAAIADLGTKLEHMPVPLYVRTSEATHRLLVRLLPPKTSLGGPD